MPYTTQTTLCELIELIQLQYKNLRTSTRTLVWAAGDSIPIHTVDLDCKRSNLKMMSDFKQAWLGLQLHESKRACVQVYPSMEQQGILWFWPDLSQGSINVEAAASPPPNFPWLNNPEFAYDMSTRDLEYGWATERERDRESFNCGEHEWGTLGQCSYSKLTHVNRVSIWTDCCSLSEVGSFGKREPSGSQLTPRLTLVCVFLSWSGWIAYGLGQCSKGEFVRHEFQNMRCVFMEEYVEFRAFLIGYGRQRWGESIVGFEGNAMGTGARGQWPKFS